MAKKKFDYFDYFKDVSDIICEAAEHLYDTIHNFDAENLKQQLDAMHEIEHKADCTKHEMIKLLVHEFITPIEREDIVSLAQSLDTVVDCFEDVLIRIYMFNVKQIKSEALEFSEIIIKCAKQLNVVLEEFKNFKRSDKIRDAIVHVNNYESAGDEILLKGMRTMFQSDLPDKELFVWTDLYEHFEDCLDACEDVTDIIESVIMKNS